MPNYGQLDDNGLCVNVILADTNPDPSTYIEIPEGIQAGYGYTYDTSTATWTEPTSSAALNKEIAYSLLKDCDWTQLADVGLTLANVAEWRTYRATLRGIVKNPQAGNIDFPAKPEEVYS